MYKSFVYLNLAVLALSCNFSENTNAKSKETTFISTMLNGQVKRMNTLKPVILKHSEINGSVDISKVKPLEWEKELAIFYSIDIFKPSILTSYGKSIATQEEIEKTTYKKIENNKLPIDSLILYKTSGTLDSICAFSSHNSVFFDSKSIYKMAFSKKSASLTSYSFQSVKTFIWGKKDTYSSYNTSSID